MRQAKEIGDRVKIVLGNESVTDFSRRVGISRQWLHDILGGRTPRKASIATLSSISDITGFNLEWLVTGRGMPNEGWRAKTTLVSRLAPKIGIRKKIILERVQDELVLVPMSLLDGLENKTDLGVLTRETVDLGGLIGPSDQVLVDLQDQKLIDGGLFIAQVENRLLACRSTKAHSVWLVSSTENLAVDSLIAEYRIIGRIRLVWKRV